MIMPVPIERRGIAAVYVQTHAIDSGLKQGFEALKRGEREVAAGEYLAVSNAYRARGNSQKGERREEDIGLAARYEEVATILVSDKTVDPANLVNIYPDGVGIHHLPELLDRADKAW